MSKYFIPLGIFVVGQLLLLGAILFLPAIGNTADTLAAGTTTDTSVFWNFDVFSSGNFVKFLVIFIIEMVTLFGVAKAFLALR